LYISSGTKVSLPRDVIATFAQRGWGVHGVENLLVILVVEDDQLVQSVVEESLVDGGFGTVIASSGENAMELLDRSERKYRALVTDINLGASKVDGWDVARHAREIEPDFPVIYMSGKDATDWASKGVPNSIMLAKPFAPAQLVTAVSQLLNASPLTVTTE
jgi:DNA-binding response OmpR family regulator